MLRGAGKAVGDVQGNGFAVLCVAGDSQVPAVYVELGVANGLMNVIWSCGYGGITALLNHFQRCPLAALVLLLTGPWYGVAADGSVLSSPSFTLRCRSYTRKLWKK